MDIRQRSKIQIFPSSLYLSQFKNTKKSKKYDHDHEIKIPTEERISKLYDIIDINKDGIITENELKSLLHIHKYPEHHPRHDQLIETAKLRMDINSDGIIEKYEYMNHMKQATKDLSDQLLFAQISNKSYSIWQSFIRMMKNIYFYEFVKRAAASFILPSFIFNNS